MVVGGGGNSAARRYTITRPALTLSFSLFSLFSPFSLSSLTLERSLTPTHSVVTSSNTILKALVLQAKREYEAEAVHRIQVAVCYPSSAARPPCISICPLLPPAVRFLPNLFPVRVPPSPLHTFPISSFRPSLPHTFLPPCPPLSLTASVRVPVLFVSICPAFLLSLDHLHHLPLNREHALAAGITRVSPNQDDILEVNANLNVHLPELRPGWDTDDEPLSMRWDSDWWRLRKRFSAWREPDRRLGAVYEPGIFTGLWQGRMLTPSEDHFNALVTTCDYPPHFDEAYLGTTTVPVFIRIEEHHSLAPHVPMPCEARATTGTTGSRTGTSRPVLTKVDSVPESARIILRQSFPASMAHYSVISQADVSIGLSLRYYKLLWLKMLRELGADLETICARAHGMGSVRNGHAAWEPHPGRLRVRSRRCTVSRVRRRGEIFSRVP
ncbi:hypothetical protein C8R44DRAFT_877541 [Mycena epipterygia]|nr:hypothetical protein C8R44DRAFT_877541 [Mycena epipterygia]